MAWTAIKAGRDYLDQFTKRSPIDALAELIWNGLDAEADTVVVDIKSSSMGATERDMYFVTRIEVSDNGHGITPEIAESAFASLGDSWKKARNGRTINDKRAMHGRLGRGRLYAYSLGSHVRWSSVSEQDGQRRHIQIEGYQDRIDGFTVGAPTATAEALGTAVTVLVEQGRTGTSSLLADDFHYQLAALLAAHLLGNRDLSVVLNGSRLNPEALIEGEPIDVELTSIGEDELAGREVPVLTVVDWKDEVKQVPGIVLCTAAGASLVEVERSSPKGPVKSTGYLKWSGFNESSHDLILATIQHEALIDEATKYLAQHVKERLGKLTETIVSRLKDENSYPYPDAVTDPIQRTEKEIFDLVAVTARSALETGNKQHRAMSARLLKVALENRPESLDVILAEALNLPESAREEVADILRHSSLGNILGAAAEVTRRLDLIATLRHVIYSPDVSKEMREVDQLHPLVKENEWLFGEAWRLSRSEANLTSILRAVIDDDVILEAQLDANGGKIRMPDGKRGRVDLLLQRTLLSHNDQQRLVVELKRPSVALGNKEAAQIRNYASALSTHSGVGPGRWTFWLVGATLNEKEIRGQVEQRDRAWGHIETTDHHDIFITTWGRLLDDAARRLDFYREQLGYDISQEGAVERVRARHAELLPNEAEKRAS